MRLSQWAKERGLSYRTAWNMFRRGQIPVRAEQLPTGTIILFPDEPTQTAALAIYAFAAPEHEADARMRLERLQIWATSRGATVTAAEIDLAAPMGPWPRLFSLLRNPSISRLCVEDRTQIPCGAFDLVSAALADGGRRLIAVDDRCMSTLDIPAAANLLKATIESQRGLAAALSSGPLIDRLLVGSITPARQTKPR